jgi:biotin carboxylase
MRMQPSSDQAIHGRNQTVILVMSAASYRAEAFLDAARTVRLNVIRVLDIPESLAANVGNDLAVDFTDIDGSVQRIVRFVQVRGDVAAVLAIDDRGAVIAAMSSARLGLPHNDPDAALAARDKLVMRDRLHAAGVPVPAYQPYPADANPASIAETVPYPCVIKPLRLSGSRGVIRADTHDEFTVAFIRTRSILDAAGMSPDENDILVEQFVQGVEVALEGLLTDGQLETLALFDKPDPLDGPFFEETIYVTPSRLPDAVQAAIAARTAEAAAAIGLRTGPVHAELRVDRTTGDIWIIELAGRSIGGLCSNVLEFGAGRSLEEVILRHAAGIPSPAPKKKKDAAGVMMIPIPRSGMLRGIQGVTEAMMVPDITGVEITAPLHQPILALPEGDRYLGFIFARSTSPEEAEHALRTAHARLEFEIVPVIPLRPAAN